MPVLPAVASDHRAAGPQPAVAFGGLDHGEGDAVLDGAGGVLVFEFDEEPADAGVQAGDLDQRRVADEREDGGQRMLRARG